MPKRPRRYIVVSDENSFVARMYELSIVGLHFDTYDQAAKYPDAKYVLDVNEKAGLLVRRVESLNHVGDLLWQEPPISNAALPISAFAYCNLIQDAFLMRTISIMDCCCLLTVEVLELNIKPRQTNIERIRKQSGNHPLCDKLEALLTWQMKLRTERNARFHSGEEEELTDDDETFRFAARYSRGGQGVGGFDRYGRKVDLKRSYNEAIGRLRQKFRAELKGMVTLLDDFYNELLEEFERRFKPKFRGTNGFGRVHGVYGKK